MGDNPSTDAAAALNAMPDREPGATSTCGSSKPRLAARTLMEDDPVEVTVKIEAPCRIIPLGKKVELTAVTPPDVPGSFKWHASKKVSLSKHDAPIVWVTGRHVSSNLDNEQITVKFTPDDKRVGPKTDQTTLTVLKVEFSESTRSKESRKRGEHQDGKDGLEWWGYDDMDDPEGEKSKAHHVSLRKSSSTTVQVTIKGGGSASHLQFASDDTSIADTNPPNGGATFDLTINGKEQNRAETTIRALCKCPAKHEFAQLKANVYPLVNLTATIVKVWDSHSESTRLRCERMQIGAAEKAKINGIFRPLVVTVTLNDYKPSILDVRYDLNNSGIFDYRSGEESEIASKFQAVGLKGVIVRSFRGGLHLAAPAKNSATAFTLSDPKGNIGLFMVGRTYQLVGTQEKQGKQQDIVQDITIKEIKGTTIYLVHGYDSHLWHDYGTDAMLLFPAAGLSSIGQPEGTFWIAEKSIGQDAYSPERLLETIAHECGHAWFGLHDLNASDCLMHFDVSGGTRLRYKAQPLHYGNGSENQWEAAMRPVELTVTSTPDGADVKVDAMGCLGITPYVASLCLAPGQHAVIVEKFGYQKWRQPITVKDGDTKLTVQADLVKTD